MKRTAKIMAIVAAVLLAGFLMCFLWQERMIEKEKEVAYTEMEKELRPLELEKRRLRQELDELEKMYIEESQGMATLVLLFTDLDEIIYNEIFPQMKAYGFIGVLTLSEEQIPGKTGCISMQQFDELMAAGWQCCLRWEKDMNASEWLLSVKKLVSEMGITRPDTVYFLQETYSSKIDNFLERQGITVVVHHGEEDLSLILSETEEGIWHPGAMGWHQEGSAWKLDDAVAQRGNLVYTTGADLQVEEYLGGTYESMLEGVHEYCEAGNLMVTDLITAREYRRNLEEGQEGLAQNFEENRAALEEQIEEIDRSIDSVTKKYITEQE